MADDTELSVISMVIYAESNGSSDDYIASTTLNLTSAYTSMTMDEDQSDHDNSNIEELTATGEVNAPSERHKKAALLVKEGKDNEKFSSLPENKSAKIAYRILHNPFYYWLALLFSLVLLLMAVWERPSIHAVDIGYDTVHLLLEFTILTFFAINLIIRFIWLRPLLFIKSRATVVMIVLIIMYLEIVAILLSQNRHFRITRALRPLFLLDTFLMFGVRRVIRQIFVCLKYIIDVMLALFFLVAVFSVIGYFLFTDINPTYFDTLGRSVVSMIITLTTANHPDVFMEAYYNTPAAPLFFFCYMFITFYYFNNVLLAVVFAKFKAAERKKFKKLFIHRREALKRAFDELKTNDRINFSDFYYFMRIYSPRTPDHEILCLFKSLKSSPQSCSDTNDETDSDNNSINWDQFTKFYDFDKMNWILLHKSGIIVSWYEKFPCTNLKITMQMIHKVIKHWAFDICVVAIVLINLIFLITFIAVREKDCRDKIGSDKFCSARLGIPGSFIFNIIYILEISVKLIFDGPLTYFRKWINCIDFVLVFGCFICLCVEIAIISHPDTSNEQAFRYIAMVRPLKLFRLLYLKRNYYFLLQVMTVLFNRMTSVLFLLLIVFYSFAIIGMEFFSGPNAVRAGCCANASYGVAVYYSNNGSTLDNANFYWLNNFDNIGRSYVTLYEEMVVNNWFIQMEGFVSTTSSAARIYFILFWITTTLVINIAIVYIVDAFESGILALKSGNKEDIEELMKLSRRMMITGLSELRKIVHLILSDDEIDSLHSILKKSTDYNNRCSVNNWIRKRLSIAPRTIKIYKGELRGKSVMTNDDLRMFLYEGEIKDWIKEHDEKQNTLNGDNNEFFTSYKKSKHIKDFFHEAVVYLWAQMKKLFFYIFS